MVMSFRRITIRSGSEIKIAYARVSSQEQGLLYNSMPCLKEGCEKMFQEKASGAK
jgi:hypothetical protein